MYVYNLNPFDIKFNSNGRDWIIKGTKHFNQEYYTKLYEGAVGTEIPNPVWENIKQQSPQKTVRHDPVTNTFKEYHTTTFAESALFTSGLIFSAEKEKDGNKRYYEELAQRTDYLRPCNRKNPNPESNKVIHAVS